MFGAFLPNPPARAPFVPIDQQSSLALAQLQVVPPTRRQGQKSVSDITYPVAVQWKDVDTSTFAQGEVAKGITRPPGVPPSSSHLKQIVTPLRLLQFKDELRHHPDPHWVSDILHGIEHGVQLGYNGPRRQRVSRNLISALKHPTVIDDELMKEMKAQRIAGPFDTPPLSRLQCSGVGVVPKNTGGWRMIMHLSAPLSSSINDGISKEDFTLRYSTVDDAVRIIRKLGPKTLLAKIDIKSAFRTIPVRLQDRELLGIYWQHKYYIDCCLPFGLRSAPYIFNQYAEALEWILKNHGIQHVIHYLDDFLIAGKPGSPDCKQSLTHMLHTCQQLGFPIAEGKIEGPDTTLVFLGILMDTIKLEMRLPERKLATLQSLLQRWQRAKKTTKRELLSLIGSLSFAAKVVPAGRIFFRRLIDLSTSVKKLHHRIKLNSSARADIQWWLDFLPTWNGTGLMLQAD